MHLTIGSRTRAAGLLAVLLGGATLVAASPPAGAGGPAPVTETFEFTGAVQTFTVPEGVQMLTVVAFGAQGGSLEIIRSCFNADGRGAIVNSSRGVMHAYAQGPLKDYGVGRWREAVVEAARALQTEISRLVA